jgi:hypothetical protein
MTNRITNVPDVIQQFPTDDGTLHSSETSQEQQTPFFGGILARHRPFFVGTLVKTKVCRVNQTEKCSMKMSYRNIPTEMLESGLNGKNPAKVPNNDNDESLPTKFRPTTQHTRAHLS